MQTYYVVCNNLDVGLMSKQILLVTSVLHILVDGNENDSLARTSISLTRSTCFAIRDLARR